MTKGFDQHPGINYHETFSLVIKPTIVCLILNLVLFFGWSLCQLDINNAFLHGYLLEDE